MVQTEIEGHLIVCLRQLLEAKRAAAVWQISHGELFLLWYVQHRDGLVLPGEISEAMSVSTARIARLLHSLEGKGLIRRKKRHGDHRKVFVTLTEAGGVTWRRHTTASTGRIAAIVDELGEADAEEFMRISERIVSISLALSSAEEGETMSRQVPAELILRNRNGTERAFTLTRCGPGHLAMIEALQETCAADHAARAVRSGNER
jgi:DNA-binding MarR family transcriptional regulator